MPLQLSLQIKNKIEELLFLYNFFRYNSGHFTKFNFANDILSIFNLVKYSFAHISIRNVRLEASSVCQLRCPACTTGNRRNKEGVIGWGILKFTDFKKFIDNNPSVKNIELSNYGEIFLNRDLKNIIKYAYEKGVFLSAGNGVNLNNISEEIIECLVKYKFKHLLVSIDGASNDTYKIYRIGGDFDRVI
ncbi:hypothetical protein HYU09_02680, partial [Candidatus Woesearchaeota archaeon]|nr:hypothetical protein [Candidatus Woesearchaeota archaeon]